MMTSFLLLALVLFVLFFVFGMRVSEGFACNGYKLEATCKNDNNCKWAPRSNTCVPKTSMAAR